MFKTLNQTSNFHVSTSTAERLKAERDFENSRAELAEHRLNLADEHIVKLTQRSKDLLYEVVLKNKKFETIIKRMQSAFPTQDINKIADGVEQEYNNDPEYLKRLRESTDSQPVLQEEKARTKSRSM